MSEQWLVELTKVFLEKKISLICGAFRETHAATSL